jgi:hypothetical protein
MESTNLEYSLILLSVCVVRLLGGRNIVLEVGDGVLPSLQSLRKELGYLEVC